MKSHQGNTGDHEGSPGERAAMRSKKSTGTPRDSGHVEKPSPGGPGQGGQLTESAKEGGPSTESAKKIWTIGHWVCPQDTFLAALHSVDIEMVVDVRSIPGSRRSPQFGIETMPGWLGPAGIEYLHISELGGRRAKDRQVSPEVNGGWTNPSFKNYADYTLTDSYHAGIRRLMRLASEHRVSIMCGEPMPWRCHRSIIANDLTARGWQVWHLSTTAKPRLHEFGAWGATPVISETGQVTYPPDADDLSEGDQGEGTDDGSRNDAGSGSDKGSDADESSETDQR